MYGKLVTFCHQLKGVNMIFPIDRIETVRGGNPFGGKLGNGDRLDSVSTFYAGNTKIFSMDCVNTDPTLSWAGKGGIMAETAKQKNQTYFICGPRHDTGKIVLFIYQATLGRNELIKSVDDLTEADRLLVSLIPNPTHGNRYEISQILYHSIGSSWDGSHGCITTDGFTAMMSHFTVGQKGIFNLTRNPAWDAPEGYLLPGKAA